MSGYLIAGASLGAVLIICHIGISLYDRVGPRLEMATLLMTSGLGIAGGARIAYLAVSADKLGPFHGEDRVYLALGGLALVWVSIATAWTTFRE